MNYNEGNITELNYRFTEYKNTQELKLLNLVLIGIVVNVYFMEFLNSYLIWQGAFLIIYFVYIFFCKKSIKITNYILPAIYFCIYLIVNILIGGSSNFIIAFILNILLLIFLNNTPNVNIKISKIMAICAFIHLFFTIMIEIIPTDITNSMFKFILDDRYWSNWDWRIQQNSNVGITNQPGNNAIYLTTLLSYCIAHLMTIKKNKNIYFTGGILSFIAIILTNKRAPILLNIFSIICLYLIYNRKKFNFIKLIKLLISIIICIITFIFLYKQTNIFDGLIDKFVLLQSSNDITNGRISLWKYAIEEFNRSPVLGVGLKSIYNTIGLDVHNIYLQILAETGFIGFTIFCVAIFLPVFNSINNIKYLVNCKDYKTKRCVLMGLYMSIYLLIYGLFSNVFIDYIPLGIFIFSIFMANSYKERG